VGLSALAVGVRLIHTVHLQDGFAAEDIIRQGRHGDVVLDGLQLGIVGRDLAQDLVPLDVGPAGGLEQVHQLPVPVVDDGQPGDVEMILQAPDQVQVHIADSVEDPVKISHHLLTERRRHPLRRISQIFAVGHIRQRDHQGSLQGVRDRKGQVDMQVLLPGQAGLVAPEGDRLHLVRVYAQEGGQITLQHLDRLIVFILLLRDIALACRIVKPEFLPTAQPHRSCDLVLTEQAGAALHADRLRILLQGLSDHIQAFPAVGIILLVPELQFLQPFQLLRQLIIAHQVG